MRKIRALKDNILATWLFSLVTIVSLIISIVLASITYYGSFGQIKGDMIGYDKGLKDYTIVDFSSYNGTTNYIELSNKMDMTGYAGMIYVGEIVLLETPDYTKRCSINVMSEAMAKNVECFEYKFSETLPNGYREAYVSKQYENYYKLGKYYNFCFNEGLYEYRVKVKIIGYTTTDKYYDYNIIYGDTFLSNSSGMVICDTPPSYINIANGIMINDKSKEYYESLGVNALSLEEVNDMNKKAMINDVFVYLCICTIILISIVIFANYILSTDKIVKRCGISYICGNTRKRIILMEILKMLTLFILSLIVSSIIIAFIIQIGISNSMVVVNWASFGIITGIIFLIYLLAISVGFIKIAKVPPLKAISGEYIE